MRPPTRARSSDDAPGYIDWRLGIGDCAASGLAVGGGGAFDVDLASRGDCVRSGNRHQDDAADLCRAPVYVVGGRIRGGDRIAVDAVCVEPGLTRVWSGRSG